MMYVHPIPWKLPSLSRSAILPARRIQVGMEGGQDGLRIRDVVQGHGGIDQVEWVSGRPATDRSA